MEYPKVLIAAPTHSVKEYSQFDWIDQLSLMTYPNFEVFLSDNSSDKTFSDRINSYGIECSWCNPNGKGHMASMAASHEECRQKAIDIGAEYLFHLEVDLFTKHRSIIEMLVLRRKAVVGGVYHISYGEKSHLCLVERKQFHYAELATAYAFRDGADLQFADGNIKQISNGGLGATLIHRSVFEKIPFRWDKEERFHPDSCFAIDCYHNKIPIYADTSLLLEHRNSKWMYL